MPEPLPAPRADEMEHPSEESGRTNLRLDDALDSNGTKARLEARGTVEGSARRGATLRDREGFSKVEEVLPSGGEELVMDLDGLRSIRSRTSKVLYCIILLCIVLYCVVAAAVPPPVHRFCDLSVILLKWLLVHVTLPHTISPSTTGSL